MSSVSRVLSLSRNRQAVRRFADRRVPADLVVDLPPVLVREVLNNLLLNALEVLPDGGRLVFVAKQKVLDNERVHFAFDIGFGHCSCRLGQLQLVLAG